MKEFLEALNREFGPNLEEYKKHTSKEEREAALHAWEDSLKEKNLPSLEKANLIVIDTMIPFLQLSNELSYEEFKGAFIGQFLILLEDALNPNKR